MHRTGPRQVALLVAVVVMLGSVSAVAPTVASATPVARAVDPPTITVTPPTSLVDGQTVSVTTNVTTPAEVSICDAASTSDLSLSGLIGNCMLPTTGLSGPTGSFVVHQTFSTASGRTVDCGTPTSCVVAAAPSGTFSRSPPRPSRS